MAELTPEQQTILVLRHVVGMDVGRPGAPLDVLVELIRSGQPIERVLPAFTSNVARLMRLPAKGRIAIGGDADLLTLDEDCRLRDVMIGGKWHIRDGRPLIVGMLEDGPAAT